MVSAQSSRIPEPIVAASFRDPSGRLVALGDRIVRFVFDEGGAQDLRAFLETRLAKDALARGTLVGSSLLEPGAAAALVARGELARLLDGRTPKLVVEHDRVEFPSFPYEWAPEMLHHAGQCTLDLATRALGEGFGLKDATPYNVLFRGPRAVFVDLLSFERREPTDPTWLPYAQFIRTFLMPLLAYKALGLSLAESLGTRRDGLEPEEMYRLLGGFRRLSGSALTLVAIPTWLGGKKAERQGSALYQKRSDSPEKARFILESVLNGLRKSLDNLAPPAAKASVWSDYMDSGGNNYSRAHFEAKEAFVRSVLGEARARRVLDVGCNTGHFSVLAAELGASVVALDLDPAVVGALWRRAEKESLPILPLALNLAWPTPGTGWRNRENRSFLDRARGSFDAVLFLAVLHHLLVSERIPLADLLELAAELTTDVAIIEFVSPEDSMFKRIARGREHLFEGLRREVFEATAARFFDVIRVQNVEGSSRWLYALRKHNKSGAPTASA